MATGKTKYPKRKQAKTAINQLAEKTGDVSLGTYKCPICRTFHHTKSPNAER